MSKKIDLTETISSRITASQKEKLLKQGVNISALVSDLVKTYLDEGRCPTCRRKL